MKHLIISLVLACLAFASCGKARQSGPLVTKEKVIHPCLLLAAGEEQKIRENLKQSEELRIVEDNIFALAEEALTKEPARYVMEGRRLLSVSQCYLKEVFALAYAYRMTHKQKYLDATVKRLEKASTFSTWNPSHFLDVSEMSIAMVIGYDWLYDKLSEQTKQLVEQAIETKAWDEALSGNYWWDRGNDNWNQVCNTGMVMSALALYDKKPEKARQLIDKYYESIKLPMEAYGPDGGYPESFIYWHYGTGVNGMCNAALRTAGMEPYETETFLRSAYFYQNMISPTGSFYNFNDAPACGSMHISIHPEIRFTHCYDIGVRETPEVIFDPAIFYFAGVLNDASLLWWPMKLIKKHPDMIRHRMLPLALIFTKDLKVTDVKAPTTLTWTCQGITPLYVTRSACNDPNAAFFGVKGGKAHANHGHMDAGSFVFEVDSVRWAVDQGSEDYYSIESMNMDLWNGTQDGDRWKLLSYGNEFHNTIMLNNEQLIAEAYAPITQTFDEGDRRGAVIDLTPVFHNVKQVTRRICLTNERVLEVCDTLTTTKNLPMRWTMLTTKDTKVVVESDSRILLERNGKQLAVEIDAPLKVVTASWPCKADNDYETSDAIAVGFNTQLPANREHVFRVRLVPQP